MSFLLGSCTEICESVTPGGPGVVSGTHVDKQVQVDRSAAPRPEDVEGVDKREDHTYSTLDHSNFDGDVSLSKNGKKYEISAGRMDPKTLMELEEVRLATSHFLFRVWNSSDKPSGGYIGPSATEAITLLAFLR